MCVVFVAYCFVCFALRPSVSFFSSSGSAGAQKCPSCVRGNANPPLLAEAGSIHVLHLTHSVVTACHIDAHPIEEKRYLVAETSDNLGGLQDVWPKVDHKTSHGLPTNDKQDFKLLGAQHHLDEAVNAAGSQVLPVRAEPSHLGVTLRACVIDTDTPFVGMPTGWCSEGL